MIGRRLAVTAALLAVLSASRVTRGAAGSSPVDQSPTLLHQPAATTFSAIANSSSIESAGGWAKARPGAHQPPMSRTHTNVTSAQQQQQQQQHHHHQPRIYTNQFVIQVKGGDQEARRVAEKHGFVYLNHILADYYHLEHRRLAKRSLATSQSAYEEEAISAVALGEEPQVLLLERQELKRRVKRDFYLAHRLGSAPQHQPATGTAANQSAGSTATAQQQQQQQQLQQQMAQTARQQVRPSSNGRPNGAAYQYSRPANQAATTGGQLLTARPSPSTASTTRDPLEASAAGYHGWPTAAANRVPPPATHESLQALAGNGASRYQTTASNNKSWPSNDPSWPLMWYLDHGARNGFDLNVMAAWKMGFTGKGIVITILDDGLEHTHPDLKANYDQDASYDINGDDGDPTPRYDEADSNRHGTRCAGEVAAVRDNNLCSIGIAYDSKVGGVRMLDGEVTDAVEARSLGLNNQHIHIYSASWGPDDNGKTVDGPGLLATTAFIEGVTNGRQGLGSIFVFASGNGGREHDNCNCDGYTNSIWTLSISSATENGLVPWYIEACSSTLATTYSSGSYDERQISTTDIKGACTSTHTGTSASAPLAAGICALVLESNPKLTWRDMQHIVVRTSKPANLVAKDWRQNALGRNVSHAFGYGLMDAAAMIQMALRWTTVPTQYTCEVKSPSMDKPIASRSSIQLILSANCNNIRYLEHVQSKLTLTATRRGDLHIYLISPQGTRSTLLAQRPQDTAEQGFKNWPFMTVHSWGESPNGEWKLEVHNGGKPPNRAYFKEWSLIMYGTSEDPNKHLDSPHHHQQQQQQQPQHHSHQQPHRHMQSQSPPAPIMPAPVKPQPGAPPSSHPQQQQQSPAPKSGSEKPAGSGGLSNQWAPGGALLTSSTAPSAMDPTTAAPPSSSSSSPGWYSAGGTSTTSQPATSQQPTVNPNKHHKEPPTLKPDYETVVPVVQGETSSTRPTTLDHNMIDAPLPATDNHKLSTTTTNNNNNNGDNKELGETTANGTASQQQTPTTTEPPSQVDLNQIDSRLQSKDYRSSGDQAAPGTTREGSLVATGTGPSSSSTASSSGASTAATAAPSGLQLLLLLLLTTTILLVLHQQRPRLVQAHSGMLLLTVSQLQQQQQPRRRQLIH